MDSVFFELKRSGLTKREFASEIGVELPRLEYWLRLAECRDESRQHKRANGSTEDSSVVQPNLPGATSLELEFPGGMLLRLPSETAPSHLRRVVAALSEVSGEERKDTDEY